VISLRAGSDEEAGEGKDGKAEALGEVLGGEGVDVVVFGEYVEEAAIEARSGGIKFGDVCVLEPVNEHFGAEHYEEGRENVSEEFW